MGPEQQDFTIEAYGTVTPPTEENDDGSGLRDDTA